MEPKRGTVVVTGACGALGAFVASEAARRNWSVVGVDLRKEAGEAAGAFQKFFGGVDLSDYSSVKKVFDGISDVEGDALALINIAGGFSFGMLADSDLDDWDRLYRMNLKTAVVACKAALPGLMASGDGRIVNVGASAALRAGAGMGAYAASKAGVAKLTESLAEELRGRVRVNAILPTIIDTPANRASMPDADFNAWTKPEDIAAAIMLLLESDARTITGACVPV